MHEGPDLFFANGSRMLAENAFLGIEKPIGVANYDLRGAFSKHLKSSLSTIEGIEMLLQDDG